MGLEISIISRSKEVVAHAKNKQVIIVDSARRNHWTWELCGGANPQVTSVRHSACGRLTEILHVHWPYLIIALHPIFAIGTTTFLMCVNPSNGCCALYACAGMGCVLNVILTSRTEKVDSTYIGKEDAWYGWSGKPVLCGQALGPETWEVCKCQMRQKVINLGPASRGVTECNHFGKFQALKSPATHRHH